MSLKYLLLSLLHIHSSLANTGKTIFLGPPTINVPSQHPTISDLHLDVLTPHNINNNNDNFFSLRTKLLAAFPTDKDPHGVESWFLLDNLTPRQRYEVRVCWPASQPTAFELQTFPVPVVWDTPELITSLSSYAYSRQRPSSEDDELLPPSSSTQQAKEEDREASLLFLRIRAKADYFTTNATLMSHPPPVDVDVILDPFVGGVLPRSLVPTVVYVVIVAGVSWFVAKVVLGLLRGVVKDERGGGVKKTQ
ncbi:hypothetical protein GE09DRAFT_1211202 [Coniochaeta sp. 2T2.1]|nr:hypothetical protein GE09DRAFT_1211202 [Coniochaeta sp. 2T2.1]